MAAHRYWRIWVSGTQDPAASADRVGITELELRSTVGGADITAGKTVTASSYYDTYIPSQATDDNINTVWLSGSPFDAPPKPFPHWIKVDLGAGSEADVLQILIRSRNDATYGAAQAPRDFLLEYSDDDSTWTTASWWTNNTGWTYNEARTFDVANPSAAAVRVSTTTHSQTSSASTWTIPLPALQVNDEVIVIIGSNVTGSNIPAGWSRFWPECTQNVRCIAYRKKADGTETQMQVTFSSAGTGVAQIQVWRKAGKPFGRVQTAGAGTAPNPKITLARTGTRNVYVAVAISDQAAAATAYPSGYVNGITSSSSWARVASACKESTSSVEDPGAFTVSNSWTVAGVICVPPIAEPAAAFRTSAKDHPEGTGWAVNFNNIDLTELDIVSGDLILMVGQTQTSNQTYTPNIPTGFSRVDAASGFDGTGVTYIGVYWKRADGTETTLSWTASGSMGDGMVHIEVWRNVGDPVGAKTSYQASTANFNPPSLNSGLTGSIVWLIFATPSNGEVAVTAAPAGFSDLYNAGGNGGWAYQSGIDNIATAYKTSTNTTEDPGAFTNATMTGHAVTLAMLDTSAPAAPASVTVAHPSQTVNVPFTISWDAVAGADSYDVRYARGGGAQQVINTAAPGTSISFTPTVTGTYVFYVRTNDGGLQSSQTASAVITVKKAGKASFDAITVLTAGEGNLSGTHTPGGTVRGVVVGIVQTLASGGNVDEIAGVTYGGVAMTRVTSSAHDASEDGRVYLYFLGKSVPQGAQTVTVTASGTTTNKVAFVFTVVAGSNTVLHAHDNVVGNAIANPSDVLALGGRESFVALVAFSGHDNITSCTPLAGWTSAAEVDQGSTVALAYRYETVDSADVTWGWAQTTEDAIGIAFAVADIGLGVLRTLHVLNVLNEIE